MPIALLVVPFLLIFFLVMSFSRAVLGIAGLRGPMLKKATLVCSGLTITMLVMQSLGQLTIRDSLAVFALAASVYFYLSRFAVQAS